MSVEQMIKDATAAKIVTTKGRYLGRVLKGTNGKYFAVAGVRDGLLIGETYDTVDAAAADDVVKQAHLEGIADIEHKKRQDIIDHFYQILEADNIIEDDGPWIGFYAGTTFLALIPEGDCPDVLVLISRNAIDSGTQVQLMECCYDNGWAIKHYKTGDEFMGEPHTQRAAYPEEDFE